MKRIAEHTYIVSGNVEIEELNQKFEEVTFLKSQMSTTLLRDI